jgi:hypothetical protein
MRPVAITARAGGRGGAFWLLAARLGLAPGVAWGATRTDKYKVNKMINPRLFFTAKNLRLLITQRHFYN